MKQTIIIVVCAIIAIFGIIYISMNFSIKNQESRLRNSIESKIKDNKNVYTAMWEILKEQAGVSEQYAEDFKAIYPKLIEGRYQHGGGQMMQWIQEHNPTFDTSLYKQIMTSIESQRETFKTSQTQLIDLSRQHNNLLTTFPSSFFLSGVEPIEIPVVINNEAEKAFSTGKEQSMELFPRRKRTKDTVK